MSYRFRQTEMLLYIVYIMTSISHGVAISCPTKCKCKGSTVRCKNKGLTMVPDGMPNNTIVL